MQQWSDRSIGHELSLTWAPAHVKETLTCDMMARSSAPIPSFPSGFALIWALNLFRACSNRRSSGGRVSFKSRHECNSVRRFGLRQRLAHDEQIAVVSILFYSGAGALHLHSNYYRSSTLNVITWLCGEASSLGSPHCHAYSKNGACHSLDSTLAPALVHQTPQLAVHDYP
jgi:hypothetical protein